MLLQRAFCHSWHKQLAELPHNFHLRYRNPIQSTQHAGYLQSILPRQQMIRCVFRSNIHHSRGPSHNLQVPTLPFTNYGGPVPPGNVVKALVFTGTFSVGCFLGASILEYENARSIMNRARQAKFNWIKRKHHIGLGSWEKLKRDIKRYWEQLSPGEKVFAPLCALNLIVFGLWRVPALRNTMMTYFCSNPAGRAVCWPMFLSTFSHYSAFHLFANMYVLHSFANAAVLALGKEQFLAVYLSAGVIASMASIMYKAVTSQAGLSIGASGAIMAILAFVCAQYPDTELSILFLPMLTFSAGAAIKVIMGIDLAGCLMGWKFFDHAAHLGGALFGIFWAYYGMEVWHKRIPFQALYHDLRKTK